MRGVVRMIAILAVLSGCEVPGVTLGHCVTGRVHGLWDGADGVALRLKSDGVDWSFTVSGNHTFQLPEPLALGASYTITVANHPARHICTVASGGNGKIADGDPASGTCDEASGGNDVSAGGNPSNLVIACTGPPVAIALSGGRGWTFDETEETQTFSGSITMQDVALTIHGDDMTTASIDGEPSLLDVPSRAIALPLGERTVPVVLTASGGLSKTYTLVFTRDIQVTQAAYAKASRAHDNGAFGDAVAVSGDTMAIGAPFEGSAATGINGNQDDDTALGAGAVYVFVRSGTTWVQQAYIKASNTFANDNFGASVALSGDTLAIGAPENTSAVTGINGDQSPGELFEAGAVYVFVRNGETWTQQAYVKASNTHEPMKFGASVALWGDTLAVGAPHERGASSGINQDPWTLSENISGAAYVFVRQGTSWTQEAYIKASNPGVDDNFGWAVAVSGDTLAVGAPNENSAARGIDGDQTSNAARFAGAVYAFVRRHGVWTQQAYIKASNTDAADQFGTAIALDADTLAVGAPYEKSAATEVDGNQNDNTMPWAGAAYVFVRDNATWAQQSYIKPSHSESQTFGSSIALSGNLLAVGAPLDTNAAAGIDRPPQGHAPGAGAAYVFLRDAATWREHAYVKPSNTHPGDHFGISVALNVDTLAVGAPLETSNATGVDGDQNDTSLVWAGAAYVFH
jgi:hypothetical protein